MGKSVSGDGELTHTEDADSKLRDGNHAKSKLAYGDESLGWNRTAVRSILEADMQKRQSQDRGLGLVFETPSIPLLARRIGRTATRAEDCLLGDITSAFAARFRGTPPERCYSAYEWIATAAPNVSRTYDASAPTSGERRRNAVSLLRPGTSWSLTTLAGCRDGVARPAGCLPQSSSGSRG